MITLVNCVVPHGFDSPGIPPPGLLTLAACVRQAGFEVRLADMAASDASELPSPDEFPQWLGEITPIVGFSTMSNMLPYALEAARCLKESAPETTIIFGGCGAQAAAGEILEQFGFIDYVFQGEAEYSFPYFLRERARADGQWRIAEGLAWREDGKVRVNPPPPRIKDLDALPLPAFDLVNFETYRSYVGLLTSRGCPFGCTYCEGSVFRRELLATHSIDRVFQEIRWLGENRGISRLGLIDDTFTVRKERAASFCRQYLEGGSDFIWGALARVDGIDLPLMKLLQQARCESIYFGVESGSDKTLKTIRKGVSTSDVLQNVPRATEFFPEVYASFMWGFPFEDESDLEETLLLAAHLRTFGVRIQMHLWAPMPRSPMFKDYQSQLVYDPLIQSNIVPGDASRYQAMIASNSTIFAPFHHVPHPAFDAKKKMIQALGFAS